MWNHSQRPVVELRCSSVQLKSLERLPSKTAAADGVVTQEMPPSAGRIQKCSLYRSTLYISRSIEVQWTRLVFNSSSSYQEAVKPSRPTAAESANPDNSSFTLLNAAGNVCGLSPPAGNKWTLVCLIVAELTCLAVKEPVVRRPTHSLWNYS